VSTPPVVAVLTANAALSSILTMMLRQCPGLRVRQFTGAPALVTYARIATVDLVVCDYHLPDTPMARLARQLREQNPRLQIIAMTRYIDRSVQLDVARAGIDETVIKPMSPRHIAERVAERLSPRLAPAAARRVVPMPGRLPDWITPRRSHPRQTAEIIDLAARRARPRPESPRP